MYKPKTEENLGGLFRSAHAFGVDFVFVIGARYRQQPTDTTKATRHIPLFEYDSISDFVLPKDSQLIGIECVEEARPLETFSHPARSVYLLGGEDQTLPPEVLALCSFIRRINTAYCLNVASAGTVVLYDRRMKQMQAAERAIEFSVTPST